MRSSGKYDLYLITESFPFGYAEIFVENEIKVIASYFDHVHIFPLSSADNKQCPLPPNVSVSDCLYASGGEKGLLRKTALRHPFLLLRIFLGELLKHPNRKYIWRVKMRLLIEICAAVNYSKKLHRYMKRHDSGNKKLCYSFWMNSGALILSIMRYKGRIGKYIFRVHGYDLYDERKEGGYMPFRHFNFSQVDHVYTASEYGADYLKKKNIHPEKVRTSHIGTFDHNEGPFDPEKVFTIVSCANLWPIKRIDKQIEILAHLDFPVMWHHFGQGPLLNELTEMARKLPSNIKWKFEGQVSNADLMKFYSTNSVNLFITLSDTEGGVPLSLQEAASFGIPLLGTRVGGIPEIVNEHTGILIPEEINIIETAKLITGLKNGYKNQPQFRSGVRKFWKEHFFAPTNYKKFVESILGE